MTDANAGVSPRWDLERAVENSGLDPESRSILFALLRQMNGSPTLEKRFSPSVPVLARVTGLSHGTVTDRLPRLRALGWLEWAGKPGQKNIYTVMDGNQSATRTGGGACTRPPDGRVPVRPMDGGSPPDGRASSRTVPDLLPDQKKGADAPPPESGETRACGSGTAQREDAENPPRFALDDSRTAVPGRSPEVAPGMEGLDPQKKPARAKRPAKPKSAERAVSDAIADSLAASFWKRHGKGWVQSYIAVRSILRGVVANGVDPRVLGEALHRLGKAGKPVSAGTLQFEIGNMRRLGGTGSVPARLPDRDARSYRTGFNGEEILSI
jgi:hypothetical protein